MQSSTPYEMQVQCTHGEKKRRVGYVFPWMQRALILLRKKSVWFNWLNLLQTLCSCVYWPHRTKGIFYLITDWRTNGAAVRSVCPDHNDIGFTRTEQVAHSLSTPTACGSFPLGFELPSIWPLSLFPCVHSLSLSFSELNRVYLALCFPTSLLMLSLSLEDDQSVYHLVWIGSSHCFS